MNREMNAFDVKMAREKDVQYKLIENKENVPPQSMITKQNTSLHDIEPARERQVGAAAETIQYKGRRNQTKQKSTHNKVEKIKCDENTGATKSFQKDENDYDHWNNKMESHQKTNERIIKRKKVQSRLKYETERQENEEGIVKELKKEKLDVINQNNNKGDRRATHIDQPIQQEENVKQNDEVIHTKMQSKKTDREEDKTECISTTQSKITLPTAERQNGNDHRRHMETLHEDKITELKMGKKDFEVVTFEHKYFRRIQGELKYNIQIYTMKVDLF